MFVQSQNVKWVPSAGAQIIISVSPRTPRSESDCYLIMDSYCKLVNDDRFYCHCHVSPGNSELFKSFSKNSLLNMKSDVHNL